MVFFIYSMIDCFDTSYHVSWFIILENKHIYLYTLTYIFVWPYTYVESPVMHWDTLVQGKRQIGGAASGSNLFFIGAAIEIQNLTILFPAHNVHYLQALSIWASQISSEIPTCLVFGKYLCRNLDPILKISSKWCLKVSFLVLKLFFQISNYRASVLSSVHFQVVWNEIMLIEKILSWFKKMFIFSTFFATFWKREEEHEIHWYIISD